MRERVTVAVDANGADLGPAEVARGAAAAAERGHRVILFGPAAELGAPSDGVEIVDAPVSVEGRGTGARGAGDSPNLGPGRGRAVEAVALFWRGRARFRRLGRVPRWRPFVLLLEARGRGVHGSLWSIIVPVPGSALPALVAGANVVRACLTLLVQFAPMCANWTRCSGRTDTFAPASSSRKGRAGHGHDDRQRGPMDAPRALPAEQRGPPARRPSSRPKRARPHGRRQPPRRPARSTPRASLRTARAGSAAFAIDTGASTISDARRTARAELGGRAEEELTPMPALGGRRQRPRATSGRGRGRPRSRRQRP